MEPHAEHLKRLGAEPVYVRNPEDLASIQGLILPGGESTTMYKLAQNFGLWEPLRARAKEVPYWGICAGSILMAREVENPAQPSLGVMDLQVRRNAYGRQLESFQGDLQTDAGLQAAVFIRAPKFARWGSSVKNRGALNGEAVFLDDGFHFVTAFHPELTSNTWFHSLLLERAR